MVPQVHRRRRHDGQVRLWTARSPPPSSQPHAGATGGSGSTARLGASSAATAATMDNEFSSIASQMRSVQQINEENRKLAAAAAGMSLSSSSGCCTAFVLCATPCCRYCGSRGVVVFLTAGAALAGGRSSSRGHGSSSSTACRLTTAITAPPPQPPRPPPRCRAATPNTLPGCLRATPTRTPLRRLSLRAATHTIRTRASLLRAPPPPMPYPGCRRRVRAWCPPPPIHAARILRRPIRTGNRRRSSKWRSGVRYFDCKLAKLTLRILWGDWLATRAPMEAAAGHSSTSVCVSAAQNELAELLKLLSANASRRCRRGGHHRPAA